MPKQRSQLIRETALELAHAGRIILSAPDVVEALRVNEFRRDGVNIFRFVGNGAQPECQSTERDYLSDPPNDNGAGTSR